MVMHRKYFLYNQTRKFSKSYLTKCVNSVLKIDTVKYFPFSINAFFCFLKSAPSGFQKAKKLPKDQG